MLLAFIRALYFFIATGAIATFCFEWAVTRESTETIPTLVKSNPILAFVVLEAITLSVILVDFLIPRKRVDVMSAIYIGLLTGVLLSYLLMQAIDPLFASEQVFGREGESWKGVATLIATLMLSYTCITFLLQTKDDFRFVIPYVEFSRSLKGGRPIILDTSALIDGRIADLIETSILDSELVVPSFVLQEVQEIADSSERARRLRGRRGLDVLRTLQGDSRIDVRVHEAEPLGGRQRSIDQRTVELAQQLSARVLTNDYSLNKLLGVQGLQAINLNDVANSLKPRFLPGELVQVKIVKEGESAGQGVGYLEDGTMIVCESAAKQVGDEVEVEVTSVLQNSAGRMIFGRPQQSDRTNTHSSRTNGNR